MVKSKTCRDAETLLKNSGLQHVQKLKTEENSQQRDFHNCCSEISRLNEKFLRPAIF